MIKSCGHSFFDCQIVLAQMSLCVFKYWSAQSGSFFFPSVSCWHCKSICSFLFWLWQKTGEMCSPSRLDFIDWFVCITSHLIVHGPSAWPQLVNYLFKSNSCFDHNGSCLAIKGMTSSFNLQANYSTLMRLLSWLEFSFLLNGCVVISSTWKWSRKPGRKGHQDRPPDCIILKLQ